MKELRTEDYLEHIAVSSGDILSFTNGFSKEAFKADLPRKAHDFLQKLPTCN